MFWFHTHLYSGMSNYNKIRLLNKNIYIYRDFANLGVLTWCMWTMRKKTSSSSITSKLTTQVSLSCNGCPYWVCFFVFDNSEDGDKISGEKVCVLLFPVCIHTVRYKQLYLDHLLKMMVSSLLPCFLLTSVSVWHCNW